MKNTSSAFKQLIEVIDEELVTIQDLNAVNRKDHDWCDLESNKGYLIHLKNISRMWANFKSNISSVAAKMLSRDEYYQILEYFEDNAGNVHKSKARRQKYEKKMAGSAER